MLVISTSSRDILNISLNVLLFYLSRKDKILVTMQFYSFFIQQINESTFQQIIKSSNQQIINSTIQQSIAINTKLLR